MNYGTDRYTNPSGAHERQSGRDSLPRAVFAFDYHLGRNYYLGSEIEFEYGGTGAAMDIEYNKEGGEIESEIEKGGEVALEQLHITKRIVNAFNVRIGHMIVPVGLTNSHHEPNLYFGTVRPESETTILPSTWHETGIAFLGYFNQLSVRSDAGQRARSQRFFVRKLDRKRTAKDFRKIDIHQSGRCCTTRIQRSPQPASRRFGILREYRQELLQALCNGRSQRYRNDRIVRRPIHEP